MRFRFSLFVSLLSLLLVQQLLISQCNPFFKEALSPRPTHYEIEVKLDDHTRTIKATQVVHFTNHSSVAIDELRFYMYLNAFKNSESSFLKGTSSIFGQSFAGKPADEWGWIDVQKVICADTGSTTDLSSKMTYISPDDGNTADQTVLQVSLDKTLLPGKTIVLRLEWTARMPRTIARSGYSKDFYLFCHWFPQLGVFEKDMQGQWHWNCHQFFRSTEFYADFGVYDISITVDKKFIMAASGCLIEEKDNKNNTVTRKYHVEDVIDFAWSINTDFQIFTDRWKDVQIQMLLPYDYSNQANRFLYILKFAFDYLDIHVGKYPYSSFTVVCPPFHALQSGLMEYPTLITTGSFFGMPKQIRLTESLLVHEFVHQYFMSMVASNEKEEPWLDEGFATYFEDRIIDAAYGQKCSLIDVFGFRLDNRELSRIEYTRMENPREGIVARPAWMFTESNHKPLIYSKTATTLHTVQNLLGESKMDQLVKSYFEQWKFKHPKGQDFITVLKSALALEQDTTFTRQTYQLFEQSIYHASVLDYAVTRISNDPILKPQGLYGSNSSDMQFRNGNEQHALLSQVVIQRYGDWIFPVEVLITFEDGNTKLLHWSGEEGSKIFKFTGNSKVISAQIDPKQKILLDINLNNNSLSVKTENAPLWKITAKVIFWIQNIFQTISFIF